uniref:Uncharacterized protein n=1 Tax=Anopheles maculatus TaxID=74869 RepID=A0A182S8B2_9DIPT
MGDFVDSEKIPKKYYRYFLKGLAYYTCHLNKACTMADLQAYVFLKSLQQLSEAELKSLSNHIMKQLVSTGIAYNQNGYFRLNELLRYAHGSSSSQQAEALDRSRDSELSSGSGLRKMVNFSNTVTMWPTDMIDGVGGRVGAVAANAPMEQDVENPPDKAEPDHNSDSDGDDEAKARTAPNASQGKTVHGKSSDSDSSDSNTTTSDDGDSNISQKPIKQTPDNESKKSESEDDTRKKK